MTLFNSKKSRGWAKALSVDSIAKTSILTHSYNLDERQRLKNFCLLRLG